MENYIEIGNQEVAIFISGESKKVGILRNKCESCEIGDSFSGIKKVNFSTILGLWTINKTKLLKLVKFFQMHYLFLHFIILEQLILP